MSKKKNTIKTHCKTKLPTRNFISVMISSLFKIRAIIELVANIDIKMTAEKIEPILLFPSTLKLYKSPHTIDDKNKVRTNINKSWKYHAEKFPATLKDK